MLSEYVRAFVQAYAAPRASAAAILSSGGGFGTAVLMVLAAYALSNVFMMLTPGVRAPHDVSTFDRHLFDLMWTYATFFIIAALIHFFGKASGGTGSREETQLIVGWHMLVTSPLTVADALFASGMKFEEREGAPPVFEWPETGTIMLAAGTTALSLWLLASYIFVLHRFHNFWGVAAVVFGVPIAIVFFLANLMALTATISQQGLPQ